MTRCLLLLLLLVAPLVRAQTAPGAWTLLPASPQAGRWVDASFLDPLTGWIIEGGGKVAATTDGGDTWAVLDTIPPMLGSGNPGLRTVMFTSRTHGFIGTLDPGRLLYETTDGGLTWNDVTGRIAGALPEGICGMWAVDDQLLYAVGVYYGPATLLKSTDGGQTWTSRDMSAYAGSLVDVYFWDADHGIAVGGTNGTTPTSHPVVLATEDGGATWAVRYTGSDSGAWAWKISFPAPNTGYVSIDGNTSSGALVLKTTDRGATWTEKRIPPSIMAGYLQGVGFVTENVGWVGENGQAAARTTDGGATWQAVSVPAGNVNRFEFFGDSLGYAMGARVYRYRRTAVATEPPPVAAVLELEPAAPNPVSGAVTLAYRLAAPAVVRLAVYDALGREVAVLHDGPLAAGAHALTLDTSGWSPGVYVVRVTAGVQTASARLVVVR